MADVQIDDGKFTQIANVLLEKASAAKLNGCQYAILLQVWRYTYGFKRKEHELSAGFLANATGYNKRQVERELVSLVNRGILIQKTVNGVSRTLSFNKDYETWDSTPGELADGEKADGESTDGKEADTPPANKPTVTPGELADQEIKSFKQNSKETCIAHFETLWSIYPKKVGKEKAKDHWTKKIVPLLVKGELCMDDILKGTQAYVRYCERSNRYLKDGSAFVNQRAWGDFLDGSPEAVPKPQIQEPEIHNFKPDPILERAAGS